MNTSFVLTLFDNAQSDMIREKIKEVYVLTAKLSVANSDEVNLNNKLLKNLDQIIQLMQVRIYSKTVLIPNLIYILGFGLLFMWVFYTVYPVDLISMGLITLYNIFIGTLIYFVLALSNPLAGPLKIDAHSFEVIQSMNIEKIVN